MAALQWMTLLCGQVPAGLLDAVPLKIQPVDSYLVAREPGNGRAMLRAVP